MRQGGRYRQLYDRQFRLDSNRYLNPGETTEPALSEARAVAEPREQPRDGLPRLPWNRSAGDPL
jgi:hypothetical protein